MQAADHNWLAKPQQACAPDDAVVLGIHIDGLQPQTCSAARDSLQAAPS